MRRIAVLFLLLAACRSGPKPRADGVTTGASEPRAALDAFLGAIRSQDLQALSRLWGGERGLARDRFSRDDLEKRELLMMCHLAHDSFNVVAESPDRDGHPVYTVRLNRRNQSRETTFRMYGTREKRWFVAEVAMDPVRDFCDRMPGSR